MVPGVSAQRDSYEPIASYALIGDCHSAALVSARGGIDWACARRFDSGAVFCRLLDAKKGGAFDLCPSETFSTSHSYLPDTNVLETVFETAHGRARVLDCFTMRTGGRRAPYRQLLRVAEGLEGEVPFAVLIEPRFDYGALAPWLRRHEREDVYSAVGGDDALLVSSGCPLSIESAAVRLSGQFSVRRGERCRVSLVASLAHEVVFERIPDGVLDQRLDATIDWWRRWVARGDYEPTYREPVVRSALVLKALTCAPTGAVIAVPTTSLPERIGGTRNWDYRYSWVRDSTLALSALYSIGHSEVGEAFKRFIERTAAARAVDLQIMYGCYGERRLPEFELRHLEGYRGSRPVRVGNAASEQRQLDVYGELVDLWHLWSGLGHPLSEDEWRMLRGLVEAAISEWSSPDQGLWEVRGSPQHFVHSKVMCWVAVDRGIELAERENLSCAVDRWKEARAQIRRVVEREGVDPDRGCFVQAFGSKELDVSLLRLPIVGFVDARDPRMRATTERIEEELGRDGLLLRRYRSDDGVEGGEGFFLMASFWLVEVLAMQGRVDEAEERLRRLLGLGSDLSLFAEEFSPEEGQLGNFPQAFTHMALIGAVQQLADAKRGESWRRSSTGERVATRERRAGGRS